MERVGHEGLGKFGHGTVRIAEDFDALTAPPGQPHGLVERMQDAEGSMGAPQRHSGRQQALAAAFEQGFELGLGQGLAHKPVRDPVDEARIPRRRGPLWPRLSPARHLPLPLVIVK